MKKFSKQSRSGFTLIELLVVIAIIAFLVTISVSFVGNMITRAREEATASTIVKIDELIQQRVEAFDRAVDDKNSAIGTALKNKVRDIERRLRQKYEEENLSTANAPFPSRKQLRVILKKVLSRSNFPQSPVDNPALWSRIKNDPKIGFDSSKHSETTESSALLYYALTNSHIFGVPPVDTDSFLDSEVADTDGDGLREFVDAWGRPLRFYRWPTRLIKPFGVAGPDGDASQTDDNHQIRRDIAGILIQGLPAPPGDGLPDALHQDPDDPLGVLNPILRLIAYLEGANSFESVYHTPNTWHRPLIVSTGSDGLLGLYEPYKKDVSNGIYGNLAQPNGDLTDPTERERVRNALFDNITNRNQRAGGD